MAKGGPSQEAEALRWVKECARGGAYAMRDHFQDRMKERGILFPDALNALKKARSCTPYLSIGGAAHGGTEWRVTGPSLDDDEPTDIVIGVEAGTNEQSRYMWLVTVLPRRATKKKGGVK